MSKSGSFFSILVPSATVFFSSGCIMILELVAGRLIARHLGASLYTWTSVIGVVLAGITIGNYLGGRIADRFPARKTLAVLFGLCSVACVITIVLNNLVGQWIWLWKFDWPLRVFSHVSLVFLIPSALLGMISPLVAKMALDRGLPTGRTVGDIYAWGAAGSIAGTFLAGFYLIATMGTTAIIWMVSAMLLLMSILYWAKFWALYLWSAIFIVLMTLAMVPTGVAKDIGAGLALREQSNPDILYEDESQYSYIVVRQLSKSPDKRNFVMDKRVHSKIIMNNIRDLQFPYTQIYAAVTHRLSQDKNKLSVLTIGGGGYTFPRYVEEVWPGSHIDVVEIDPSVTEAAKQMFGLEADTTINTFSMDARNYVDELLERKHNGEPITQYNFIYEDAFGTDNVPYQLVSKEFNDKISQILTDDGAYMVNIIETYNSGLFLGAIINTLQQTFANVHVLSDFSPRNAPVNFVVIATKRQVDLENMDAEKPIESLDLQILSDSDIETLKEKAHRITLTDNYAPVENLLAPVVRDEAIWSLALQYVEQAEELEEQGKWDKSIAKYKDAISTNPLVPMKAYLGIVNNLAMQSRNHAKQGRWEEAVNFAKSALEYNAKSQVKQNVSSIYHYMGVALKKLGRNNEAAEYLHKAIQKYQEDLVRKPDTIEIIISLGNTLAEAGAFSEATKYFQQAVDINPLDVENWLLLTKVLLVQERYDEATKQLQKGIKSMLDNNRKESAVKLQKFLETVEPSQLKQKSNI